MELPMMAQVSLVFTVNCESVSVPVLVQPNSEQACLLGLNVIPLFGIKLVDSYGRSIFFCNKPEPSTCSNSEVDTGDSQPIRQQPYCTPEVH